MFCMNRCTPETCTCKMADKGPSKDDLLYDLLRRIKGHQAHISGKENQKDFIALCDEAMKYVGE